jgi:hypothetical protein
MLFSSARQFNALPNVHGRLVVVIWTKSATHAYAVSQHLAAVTHLFGSYHRYQQTHPYMPLLLCCPPFILQTQTKAAHYPIFLPALLSQLTSSRRRPSIPTFAVAISWAQTHPASPQPPLKSAFHTAKSSFRDTRPSASIRRGDRAGCRVRGGIYPLIIGLWG